MAASAIALVSASCGTPGSRGPSRESAPLGDDVSHEWTLVLTGAPSASGSALAAGGGGLTIAGTFQTRLQIGDHTVAASGAASAATSGAASATTSADSSDGSGHANTATPRGFLARRSNAGQIVWAWPLPDSLDGHSPAQVSALTADASGRSIVAIAATDRLPVPRDHARTGIGSRSQEPQSRSQTQVIEVSGAPGAVLAAFTGQGQLEWLLAAHGSQHLRIADLALAGDGSIVGTGVFTGTMRMADRVVTSAGFGDIFAFRVDSQGRLLWLWRAGGRGPDAGLGIAALGDRIAIVGTFTDSAYIGRSAVEAHGRPTRRRRPRQDGFAARANIAGAVDWAMPLGGEGADSAFAIALDDTGTSYVAGAFARTLASSSESGEHMQKGTDDGFIAAITDSGQLSWTLAIQGPGHNRATAVSALGDGIAIAGSFARHVALGPHQLFSAGAHDIFAAKLHRSGRVTWAQRFGGAGHDAVADLVSEDDNRDDGFGGARLTLLGSFADKAELGGPTATLGTGNRSGFALRFRL